MPGWRAAVGSPPALRSNLFGRSSLGPLHLASLKLTDTLAHCRPSVARVFTPEEIDYCKRHRNRFERYAGRFAAKEAAMKALGTGWRNGVRWVDIEVVRLRSGKPTLQLRGAAREFADRLQVKNISLTITHSGNTALAQVIFEG